MDDPRRLGLLLRLAHQNVRDRLERAVAPYDLSVSQFSALSVLHRLGEASSADLARAVDVTPQSMNTVVHQLRGRGLLAQVPGAGRVIRLRLGDEGRRVFAAASRAVGAVERDALAGLSARQVATVTAWLTSLAGPPDDAP